MYQPCRHWLGRSLAIAMFIGTGATATAPIFPPAQAQAPTPEELTMMINSLADATWQLVSYRGPHGATVAAVSDHIATIQFEGDQAAGTTGCNRFFSSYTQVGNTLTFGPAGATLMACNPETLAQQEAAILSAFPEVASYTLERGQLTLLDRAGETLLTFQAQLASPLPDTEWTLVFYNNRQGGLVTPLLDSTITARFAPDGTLAGSAGCNTYQASYDLTAPGIAIGPAASTRRLCAEPVGVMEQEAAFLGLLPDVMAYTIEGDRLEFQDAQGRTLLRFTGAPAPTSTPE